MKKYYTYSLLGYWAIILMALTSTRAFAHTDVSGFMSLVAFSLDAEQNYNFIADDSVDFQNSSRVGLNFTSQISEKWMGTVQLFAQPASSSFESRPMAEIEIALARWIYNDNTEYRFGKIRTPFNMVSEYYEVGYLQPWLRAPTAVYDIIPVSSFYGATVMKKGKWRHWEFEAEVHVGTVEYDGAVLSNQSTAKGEGYVGAKLQTTWDDMRLHFSYGGMDLTVVTPIKIPAGVFIPPPVNTALPNDFETSTTSDFGWVNLYSFGLEFNYKDWVLMAEAIELNTSVDTLTNAFASFEFEEYWGWYATVGRHFPSKKQFIHFTGSCFHGGVDTFQEIQHELGWNYYVNDNAVFKLSVTNIFVPKGRTGSFVAEHILSPVSLDRSNYTLIGAGIDVIF